MSNEIQRNSKAVLWKRADIVILLGCVFLAAAFPVFGAVHAEKTFNRPHLEILQGNTLIGSYDLTEDQQIMIGEGNVCEIRGGQVRMTEADCPDQICVHSKAIDQKGGSIVCLPNHIILRIAEADSRDREVDTIAE
ncbi:MAG: NusG domain II-containing protein [Eubacterium sp.]|nr:NusG domain II-containing protein [Eubacterium sp.]